MAKIISDKMKAENVDDVFGIVCGDLGMGEGLKPGGLLQLNSETEESEHSRHDHNIENSSRLFYYDTSNIPEDSRCGCKNLNENTSSQTDYNNHNKLESPSRKKSKSKSSELEETSSHQCQQAECDCEDFPSYANVPLGTSLRQQKKLYETNLGTILRNHSQPAILMVNNEKIKTQCQNRSSDRRRLSSSEIEKKLVHAVTEVGELQIELETCRRRLDAKYRAIAILKKQAEEARDEMEENDKMSKKHNCILAKLEGLEVMVAHVEQTVEDQRDITEHEHTVLNLKDIDDDYSRVCQENAVLMSTLESRSEELRRVNSRKMALSRERDELLALMDVKEKLKYEKTKSQSSEDEYGTFSATELAVLGACRCRGNNPEPCGCAHAAASLRKDVIKVKEEIDLQKQRTEETYLTVDAYRKAFEEQLHKNRVLSLKLAELSVPSVPKSVKAKAAIKWLISVLNDDDLDMTPSTNGMIPLQNGPRMYSEDIQDLKHSVMAPQELITLLTEMVHEKNEVLAHQKLAAQVLANKNKQLTEQLTALKDEDVFK